MSWLKECLLYLVAPWLVNYYLFSLLFKRSDKNSLHNSNFELAGSKTIGYIQDMQLSKIKQLCKARKCTVNDYSLTLVSCAFYKYFEKKDGKVPESILIPIPFTTRQPFELVQDVNLTNDFTMIFHRLRLFKSVEDGLP